MTDQNRTVPKREARLLFAIDDAVCQYQYETLEARGVMEFIRHLERHGAGLGEVFTDDTEPAFRAIFGLAKSFEDAAATMCDRVRAAEAAEDERQGA